MRSRVTALALTAGLLVFSSAGAAGSAASQKRFGGWGVSFSYPSAWTGVDWCWKGSTVTPLVMLTTAHKAPVCTSHTKWGSLPTRLNRGDVAVWWQAGGLYDAWFSMVKNTPAVRVDREPARSATIRPSNSAQWRDTGCGGRIGGDLALVTQIRPPHGDHYLMTACLRGPRLAASRHAVREMLASVRFADYVR